MPKRSPTTVNAIASYDDDPDAIVEAGEVVDLRFPVGNSMSLRGAKLFHMLIKEAGINVVEPVTHKITFAAINEVFHVSIPELEKLIDELHTTTLKIRLTDNKGRRYTKSGPLLSDVEREDEKLPKAEIRFEFSSSLRKAISNSNHWAVISRRAVLAFESKYSLRLYTILSLRAGRRHTSETFSLADLRELLGVPTGKLGLWKNLKLRALDPAIAEINQLAGFHAGYVTKRRGRSVEAVTLTWGLKGPADRADAMKELERPRVGRKARRDGTAGAVVEADEGPEREAISSALGRFSVGRTTT